jgi:hypothetical protein
VYGYLSCIDPEKCSARCACAFFARRLQSASPISAEKPPFSVCLLSGFVSGLFAAFPFLLFFAFSVSSLVAGLLVPPKVRRQPASHREHFSFSTDIIYPFIIFCSCLCVLFALSYTLPFAEY